MNSILIFARWQTCLIVAGGIALAQTGICAADAPPAKTETSNRFTLDRLNQIVQLSSPQISPDGKRIALMVRKADAAANDWAVELVLVDVATGAHRTLTHARKGVSHPRWSPSGDRLAFLAMHGAEKEAAAQIFILTMDGGDARPITKTPTGVQHFSWSPDGLQLAFATADEPANKKAAEKGEDAFEIGNDDVFTTAAPLPVHIWTVSASGGDAKRLTSGTWSLPVALPPSPPASPISWSPDGKRLAFVRQETPHTGDSDRSTVQVLELGKDSPTGLTGETKFEGFPTFSPDGKRIAYWFNRDRDAMNVNDLFVAPASGGPGTNLTNAIDRCFYQCIWMPDGKSLLTGAHDGTRTALWVVPLDGKAESGIL